MTQHQLQNHIFYYITDEKVLICKLCFKKFATPRAVKSHKEKFHGKTLMQKKMKGIKTQRAATSTSSVSTSSVFKLKLACQICGAVVLQASRLLEHLQEVHKVSGINKKAFYENHGVIYR